MNQVYNIVVDISLLYEHHLLAPISAEECSRLLDAVQGFQVVPSAAPGHGQGVGAMQNYPQQQGYRR